MAKRQAIDAIYRQTEAATWLKPDQSPLLHRLGGVDGGPEHIQCQYQCLNGVNTIGVEFLCVCRPLDSEPTSIVRFIRITFRLKYPDRHVRALPMLHQTVLSNRDLGTHAVSLSLRKNVRMHRQD